MPSSPDDLTMADLERMLHARQQHLDDLYRKRDKLEQQLEAVNAEIEALVGGRRGAGEKRSRHGPRTQNARALRDYVLDILARYKKGLSLTELSEKVVEAGYRSNAQNFRNVLYQCVYNTKGIYHDESTGTYRLKVYAAKDAKAAAEGKG